MSDGIILGMKLVGAGVLGLALGLVGIKLIKAVAKALGLKDFE